MLFYLYKLLITFQYLFYRSLHHILNFHSQLLFPRVYKGSDQCFSARSVLIMLSHTHTHTDTRTHTHTHTHTHTAVEERTRGQVSVVTLAILINPRQGPSQLYQHDAGVPRTILVWVRCTAANCCELQSGRLRLSYTR